jgi:hypothetical protein
MLVWMMHHLYSMVIIQQCLHILLSVGVFVVKMSLLHSNGFVLHLSFSKLRIREIDWMAFDLVWINWLT